MMDIINKIYRKGLIEATRIAQKWERADISYLLMKCNQDKVLFKMCVRDGRGKHSIAKMIAYCEQGKMYKYI